MNDIKYLYRYEAQSYSMVIDAQLEIYGSTGPKLELREYPIVAITPKGKWIGWFGSKDRWVSDTSRKRFAHETKEDALKAYKIRKERYVKHCEARLERAKKELLLVDRVEVYQHDLNFSYNIEKEMKNV